MAGAVAALAPLRAQTITFHGAQSPTATYSTSGHQPADALVFEAGASLDQILLVDTDNFAVTMNSGSSIHTTGSTAYALRFTSTGSSLTATDATIDFNPTSASSGAAVSFANGGSFTATGGSIAYNPVGALSSINYVFRNIAGSMALSLTDVAVTAGTTTSHRGYGIDLAGGGTVDLLGTTTVTSRQGEALKLNGAYTVTNAGTITRLSASGADANTAVRLTGGVTTFTNAATGVINGDVAAYSTLGALTVSTDADGSTINNLGTIDGIGTENTGGYNAALTVTNSGTIARTNYNAISMGGGSVTNSIGGIISSTSSQAVLIGSGQATADFNLTNAGAITGTTAVHATARTIGVTNQSGGTLTGTGLGSNTGMTLTVAESLTVTNAGTITGSIGAQITASGDVASAQAITVTNTGTITGTANQGLRVDNGGALTAPRNVSISNQSGALIQGGTTTPGVYNIVNSAVYASAAGAATLTVDNRGTIDARNQTSAIAVTVRDTAQATVTLHTGSTTTGAIRGNNPNNDIGASVTLAFDGTGSYAGTTAGINRYLKSTAGTWTYSGERTGGRIEITAGTLELTNRDQGSSTNTTITNGTLRLAPAAPMSAGLWGLNTDSMTIDTGGRLEITANARANFGGSGGTQQVRNAGVLLLDGIAGFSTNTSFAINVNNNGLLAGTGSMSGYARVENGGILDAGNGNLGNAGLFTVSSSGSGSGFILGNGGVLRWTLASLSESNPGVNFDQVVLSGGSSSFDYESGALLALDFAAFGDGPEAGESFWESDRQWSFINGGTITDGGNLKFAANSQSTYAFGGVGYFSLDGDGRTLFWTADISAVPEPSTYALFAGLGVLGLVLWRRKKLK